MRAQAATSCNCSAACVTSPGSCKVFAVAWRSRTSQGDVGKLALRIVRPFAARQDFRDACPIAKLDIGDIDRGQFGGRDVRFQDEPIEEAFLEFGDSAVVGGAAVQGVEFLVDVEQAGDEVIEMAGNVNQQVRIVLPLAPVESVTTPIVALGEGRVERCSSSRKS